MKQIAIRRSMALLLAVALVLTMGVSCTFAKTKPVKKCGFTTEKTKVSKKATKVKRGTTILKYKGQDGFIKFKAPKTKKYKITFSNIHFEGYYGYYQILKSRSHGFLRVCNCKTMGGKNKSFRIASKGNGNTNGTMKTRNVEKRSAILKIKKGKTIYIYFWHATFPGEAKSAKATLTIK